MMMAQRNLPYRAASRRLRVGPTAAGLLLAALAAAPAIAADYTLGGAVHVDANYDDNIRLIEDGGPSAFGQTVAPNLKGAINTERFEASVDTQLRFLRFNRSELDSDDQTLQTDLQWVGERYHSKLMARWVRDTTLTSERLDSGRVGRNERRETYLVQPSWTYYLTERNLLTVSGTYNDTQYKDDAFTDYDYTQASLRWSHVLDERLQLLLVALYSDYRSADRDFPDFQQSYSQRSEDFGLQAGAQYQWSENLSATALAGRSRTKQRYDLDDPRGLCSTFFAPFLPLCRLEGSEDDLSTLDASVDWKSERNLLTANVNRSTQPSSDGQLLEATQLRLGWTYQLWEHGQLETSLTLGRHSLVGSGDRTAAERSERDFGYASLGYRHQVLEDWYVTSTYQYRYQDYEISPSDAQSHAITLGLTYRPAERHWSR